jgi:hypothetical protein
VYESKTAEGKTFIEFEDTYNEKKSINVGINSGAIISVALKGSWYSVCNKGDAEKFCILRSINESCIYASYSS